jgi:hypothetical protein
MDDMNTKRVMMINHHCFHHCPSVIDQLPSLLASSISKASLHEASKNDPNEYLVLLIRGRFYSSWRLALIGSTLALVSFSGFQTGRFLE